jgi:hypothetical protein
MIKSYPLRWDRNPSFINDTCQFAMEDRVVRLPWMTTRRWMIAVATAAPVLGAKRLADRRAYFLMRAEVEADRANDYANCLPCLNEEYDVPGMYEKLRDHYLGLARKYRLAANRPWLPVEPDPEGPKP